MRVEFLKKIGDAIEPLVNRMPAQAVIHRAEKRGIHTLHAMAGSILEQMNITPVYIQETVRSGENLRELRSQLNHEPGIVIANHPGGGDVFAVTKLIERTDVLVLASTWAFKNFKGTTPLFDHFLEVTEDPQKLRTQFQRIKEHITKGGLLVIFPTGGDKEELIFRNGFKFLVENILRPTDMVYSCWVNPADAASIKKDMGSRTAGVFVEGVSGEIGNLNRLGKARTLHVDERYTQAQEWKEVVTGSPRREANTTLTQHFLSLWNDTATAKGHVPAY